MNPLAIKPKRMLTAGVVAAILGVPFQIVHKAMENGSLKGSRLPGNQFRRFHPRDVVKYMRANRMNIGSAVFLDACLLLVCSDTSLRESLADALRQTFSAKIIETPTPGRAALQAGVYSPCTAVVVHDPTVADDVYLSLLGNLAETYTVIMCASDPAVRERFVSAGYSDSSTPGDIARLAMLIGRSGVKAKATA